MEFRIGFLCSWPWYTLFTLSTISLVQAGLYLEDAYDTTFTSRESLSAAFSGERRRTGADTAAGGRNSAGALISGYIVWPPQPVSIQSSTTVTIFRRPRFVPLFELRYKRMCSLVRLRAYYFHVNVWATTQHTFECPHERSKVWRGSNIRMKIIGRYPDHS